MVSKESYDIMSKAYQKACDRAEKRVVQFQEIQQYIIDTHGTNEVAVDIFNKIFEIVMRGDQ